MSKVEFSKGNIVKTKFEDKKTKSNRYKIFEEKDNLLNKNPKLNGCRLTLLIIEDNKGKRNEYKYRMFISNKDKLNGAEQLHLELIEPLIGLEEKVGVKYHFFKIINKS